MLCGDMMRKILRVSLGWVFACVLVFLGAQPFVRAQLTSLPSIEVTVSKDERTNEVDWNPAGTHIAWAVSNAIRIYTANLQLVMTLEGHTDEVNSIDWSPTGTQLVSGSSDGTLRIWDINLSSNSGTLNRALTEHAGPVIRVAWSPDATKIASLGFDSVFEDEVYNATWIWDATNGAVLKTLLGYKNSSALAWSPDSQTIANGGSRLPGGDPLAVRAWNVVTGEQKFRFVLGIMQDEESLQIDWHSNGVDLAILAGSATATIRVVNMPRQTEVYSLRGKNDGFNLALSVDWSPDNSKIAMGDYDGNITIWDVSVSQPIVQIAQEDGREILDVEWSPDGTKLAIMSTEDRALRIWDTTNLPSVAGTPTLTPRPTFTATP